MSSSFLLTFPVIWDCRTCYEYLSSTLSCPMRPLLISLLPGTLKLCECLTLFRKHLKRIFSKFLFHLKSSATQLLKMMNAIEWLCFDVLLSSGPQ